MYPTPDKTILSYGMKQILDNKVHNPSIFSGMIKLEMATRGVVEAYLTNTANTKLGVTSDELGI